MKYINLYDITKREGNHDIWNREKLFILVIGKGEF